MTNMTNMTNKPKSWIGFLALTAMGFLVFAPVAAVGLSMEWIPMFLTGMTGLGLSLFTAAFMGIRFATGLAEGRYRDIQPLPWREQVW